MKPDTWMGRLAQFIAPVPPEPMQWIPPALSAAATAPPAAMTPVLAHNTPVAAEWQETAWAYYRQIGAARQGVEWLANGLSRCHLYVGLVQADGVSDPMPVQTDKPVTEADQQEDPDLPDQATVDLAREILSELHDGAVGQGEMLKRLAIHLLVPGESWLIAYARPPLLGAEATGIQIDAQAATGEDAGTAWAVVSRHEWQPAESGGVRVKLPRHPQRGADGWVELPAESTVVIPVYQADPEDALRATSRFESIVRDLDELDGLSRRVAADILSRLVGAGVFAVPESAILIGGPTGMTPLNGDPLVTQLMSAASTAVKNPDSPSAHVPIMLKISDEAIAKLQHLTFATPFDAQVPVLRDAARKAVAVGLDIPANVVLGVEDLNHWCADETTEILTYNGWRAHNEIEAGDLVLTVDHHSGQPEWQPVDEINRWRVEDHEMVALDGPGHSSLTTPNHRWPVLRNGERTWTTTAELQRCDLLLLPGVLGRADMPLLTEHDSVPVSECQQSTVDYTGVIWCPTTGNRTWVARRNGHVFLTGNSAWSIDEQAIKSHLGPLASTICTTLTREVLWPVLRAAGHERVERLAVWWNAEAITLRPDRSTTTLQAHLQGIIGGRAARRVLSFGEEDAPSPEELAAAAAAKNPPPAGGDGDGSGGGRAPDEGGQPTQGDQPNPPKQPTGQEPQKVPAPA